MRLIAIAALAGLLASPAHADTMKNCAAAWMAKPGPEKVKSSYQAWSKTCLAKGYTVSATATATPASAAPAGATAMCKDNTYTKSKTAQGRCSGHGGVAKVL